ncbi:hypothetical protein C943_03743 [Mariniradius saccharolyticus AK6]|uniref:Uncharacterized protein n=1 Tax=Mariniradius saccharolyticus AK6 TaxID=1239962 RepID=M7XI69_9BACT|nr:hypothetical protein C943_03743 [Mariniradius saccharolyticus AK6]
MRFWNLEGLACHKDAKAKKFGSRRAIEGSGLFYRSLVFGSKDLNPSHDHGT